VRLHRAIHAIPIFPRFFGLPVRATIIVAGVIGLSVALSSSILLRVVSEEFRRAARQSASDLARQVDFRLTDHFKRGAVRREGLEVILQEIIGSDRRILYMDLRDQEGDRILASAGRADSDRTRRGDFPAPAAVDRPLSETEPTLIHHPGGRPIYYCTGRIDGAAEVGGVGAVGEGQLFYTLGVDDMTHHRAMSMIRATTILMSGLVVITSAPLTFLLMRRLTRPLRRLGRAAEDLSTGRQPRLVRANRSDEVGQLIDSFNTMAERLSAAHHRIRNSKCR